MAIRNIRFNIRMAKHKLKEILKKKKMTDYAFAKLMGTSQSNIRKYTVDDSDPRLSTLAKWAKALGISIKDLVED